MTQWSIVETKMKAFRNRNNDDANNNNENNDNNNGDLPLSKPACLQLVGKPCCLPWASSERPAQQISPEHKYTWAPPESLFLHSVGPHWFSYTAFNLWLCTKTSVCFRLSRLHCREIEHRIPVRMSQDSETNAELVLTTTMMDRMQLFANEDSCVTIYLLDHRLLMHCSFLVSESKSLFLYYHVLQQVHSILSDS